MKKMVEGYLGYEISEEQYASAQARASRKLASIVDRFGTKDGQRNEPYYLAQLIAEDVKKTLLSRISIFAAANVFNIKKEHPENRNAPNDFPYCNTEFARNQYGG